MAWPFLKVLGDLALRTAKRTESGILIPLGEKTDFEIFATLHVEIRCCDSTTINDCVANISREAVLRSKQTFFPGSAKFLKEKKELLIPLQKTQLENAVSVEFYDKGNRNTRNRVLKIQ